MEQQAAKWFLKCISVTLVLLGLTAAATIIIDPYFHYHKPLQQLSYRLYEERYVNDGISRHFDYDAIITGTSMAQNFKVSEMNELFGTNAVKEPFSGAGYQELSQNLERALKRNAELKTVLWAVDYNGLLRAYDWQQYEEYPDYLYDENPFNDVSYVLNKSVLYHGAATNVSWTITGNPGTTMDEYSSWVNETGLRHIMNSYARDSLHRLENVEFGEQQRQTVTDTIRKNIVDLVSRYPDTTFYIYYTPYSICYWDGLNIRGTVEQQVQAEKTATELLLDCSNVKLYNFFDQYDVICDTNYYNDDGHYSAEINSRILNWIHEDIGLVTRENYLEKLSVEQEFYLNYDYDSIYEELEQEE